MIKQEGAPLTLNAQTNPAIVYLARFASEHSRLNLKSSLDLIARYLTRGAKDAIDYPWHMLRYEHVQTIRSSFLAGIVNGRKYAPNSVNRHLCALTGVLKECWRLGLLSAEDYQRAVDIEPAKGSRLPAGRALARREIKALFEACADGTERGIRNAAILGLSYAAGLRRSELVTLNVRDWNEGECTLRVQGKGNKERLVHLHNGARDALKAWLRLRETNEPDAPLFVAIGKGKDGEHKSTRLTSQAVYNLTAELAKKAGIKNFSPHDLRRSFISDLLDAGADITTVQHMAGHASVTTTARYDRRGEYAKAKASTLLTVPFTEGKMNA